MGLTDQEKAKVLAQLKRMECPHCGDMLVARDDGVSSQTEWGVSGAYVSCESCGHEAHKQC